MEKKLTYNSEMDALTAKELLLLEKLAASIHEFVQKSPEISNVPYKTRAAHATTYSVLKGKFILSDNLEEQHVFPAKKMDATLRISNAHMKILKKKGLPAYGFSLKLEYGGRTVANFPLVNFPLFPFHNVSSFLRFFTAINRFYSGTVLQKVFRFLTICTTFAAAFPGMLHPSFINNVYAFIKKRKDFLLAWNYHSIGVYRLGNHLVKLQLIPDLPLLSEDLSDASLSVAEYLLKNGHYTANLFVQYAQDINEQPVNKLNREWRNSPLVPAGTFVFTSVANKKEPQQEFLSFNPFENSPELQPVGKIQQLRKRSYEASLNERTSGL